MDERKMSKRHTVLEMQDLGSVMEISRQECAAFLARARIVVCSKQPEALFVVVEVHGIKHCANPTKEWPCGFCTGIHFAACAYGYLVLRLSLDSSHFGIGAQIHIRTGSTSRS